MGAGRFGEKHLSVLLEFDKKKSIELAGVVVKTERSAKSLENRGFPVYTPASISKEFLQSIDGVDIVTPPETHFDLIKQCLPLTNVLVEKPMTITLEEARTTKKLTLTSGNVLMVGHIYRFHPIIDELQKILKKTGEKPSSMEGTFTNPADTDNGRDIELEFLHLFDIADFLFRKPVIAKFVQEKDRTKTVSLKYKGDINAVFKIGWTGKERTRNLRLIFKSQIIVCDLAQNTIVIYKNGRVIKMIKSKIQKTPLEAEIGTFLDVIKKKKVTYPNANIGHAIINIATKESLKNIKRVKIAIIGAGVFGTNCAIELAKSHEITLFEKNKDILSEASFINQYRHHWGYHYPRSQSTVDDIQRSIKDFEKIYGNSVIREFPTYYAIAKKGSKVSAKEYTDFCDRNKLPYTIEYPDETYLDRNKTSTCLKTFEPIYDFKTLKQTIRNLLGKRKVKLKLESEVIDGYIIENGKKILVIKDKKGKRKEEFDYVINVTYARHNEFCRWFGFHIKPIRLDFVETLWMKLNLPKMSFAIMDGPFTNMVPTGKKNIFTLVHIKESMLRRFVPRNGLVPKDIFLKKRSRAKKIIERSAEWLPVIKKAKYMESHYVLRGVNAYREHDDARPSDIADYGFGCWSVLGGKIINSVTLAKEMAGLI